MSTFDATKPLTTDNYSTVFVPTLQGNFASLAFGLDGTYVSAYGTLSTGMKRINSATGLIEQWGGSAWAALTMNYLRTDGSNNMTGAITFPNAVGLYWKDAGGTARRTVLGSGVNYYIGDIDNVTAGSALHLAAQASLSFEVNSTVLGTMTAAGFNWGAKLLMTPGAGAEAIRINSSGGYIGFWNTGSSTRSGYLQANAASDLTLIAENGSTLQFGTASVVRALFDTSGQFIFQTATAYIGHNNTTANIVIGAAPSLVDGTARIELYDVSHATLAKYIMYRGDTHTWTKSAGSTSLMTLSAAGTLVVGSSLSSTFDFANRGVIQVSGATNAIFGMTLGGVSAGYLYHDGSNMHLANVVSGGGITLDTSSTTRLNIDSTGRSVFTGAAATSPYKPGSVSGAVALNTALSNVIEITLNGNMTSLTLPNLSDGQTINLFITQDGTGSRTMAGLTNANGYVWPGGTVGVLSTAAGAVDLLVMTYRATVGKLYCTLTKGFA